MLSVFAAFVVLAAPAAAHLSPTHADSRAELARMDIESQLAALEPATALPSAWCGVRTTADSPGAGVSSAQFKVVYAYPSDRPDRSAEWADALQADISTLSRFVGAQSGGRKAPRFDMGTTCGPEYVDIQVVQLPGTRSAYVDDFAAVTADVATKLNASPGGPRDTVVLADTMSGDPVGYWSGLATVLWDESTGAGNRSNAGGLFSVMWVPDGEPAHQAGWWPEGILHEMTHNMGGVQRFSPHSSTVGHCWDGWDVMCYADGGPTPMTYPCPQLTGVMAKTYDCGGDDYFNPAPASGSYLDTHWNVYASAFMASCASIAPACGEVDGTPLQPPVSTSSPVVSGTARVGEVLTATHGAWTNAPTDYQYAWEREVLGSWTPIGGAILASYAPTNADVGSRLRVRVIASNADGSVAEPSEPTAAVAAATPVAPVPTPGATPTASPAPTTPPPAVVPIAEPAATPPLALGTLRVTAGKGRGKRLAAVRFRDSYGRVRVSAVRVKLARGRYTVRLCSAFGCASRTLKVRRAKKVLLPTLTVTGSPAGARFTLTARTRRFAARAIGA